VRVRCSRETYSPLDPPAAAAACCCCAIFIRIISVHAWKLYEKSERVSPLATSEEEEDERERTHLSCFFSIWPCSVAKFDLRASTFELYSVLASFVFCERAVSRSAGRTRT